MIAARQIDYITEINKALLRSILYFDIFNYPITAEEARAFAPFSINVECEQALDNLVADGLLFKHNKFYSIQNNFQLAIKRQEGSRLADVRMKTARRFSKIVASFPFVRAVLLSGSISKGFMDKESDIDYFIITEEKRLWIVRTALAVFRRVFLLNSHKNLCTNYFVDVENLSIPDQNIFAATELVTLVPMYGQDAIQRFRANNCWAFELLPQGKFVRSDSVDYDFWLKKFIEKIFSFRAMDQINRWLMNKSMAFWKRKYLSSVGVSDFDVAFRTKEGVSKGHPRFFQKRALETLSQKIQKFEADHDIDLTL